MIARAFPYDRPCRFQKFEATETILATGTTIWKPGFMSDCEVYPASFTTNVDFTVTAVNS